LSKLKTKKEIFFRVAKKARSSKSHGHNKSYHRSSTRHNTNLSQSISSIQRDHKMSDDDDNIHQQSTSSITTNENEELNDTNNKMDDDIQDMQLSSSINSTDQQKRRLPYRQQSIKTSLNSKSDLLSVRTSIQKGKNSI